MKKTLLSIMLLLSSSMAFSEGRYVCSRDGAERVIEVVYTEPGVMVPCEVQYAKDGSTETLWSAQTQANYCEEKAAEFAEKQASLGWTCTSETENNTDINSTATDTDTDTDINSTATDTDTDTDTNSTATDTDTDTNSTATDTDMNSTATDTNTEIESSGINQ